MITHWPNTLKLKKILESKQEIESKLNDDFIGIES